MLNRSAVKPAIHTLIVLLLLFLFAGGNAPVAHAATITVNSIDDSTTPTGFCKLREAIINANNDAQTYTDCPAGSGADIINITATGTITLASALPTITGGLTINGPGASALTISGASTYRVFQVAATGEFTLQDLTIANGNVSGISGFGGAILVDAPTSGMLLNRVTFSNNHASSRGGAIYSGSGSTLTIKNSTFLNNIGWGGAISNEGFSTLIVANSTFSGNTSLVSTDGGTIVQNAIAGSTTLTNVTINTNAVGAPLYNSQGALTIQNSIVRNPGGNSCIGLVVNGGNNIDSGTSCGWGSANGSLSNTDPKLGGLADNGGPTRTMALLADSPAINAGNATFCAAAVGSPTFGAGFADQRGYARRNWFCDIGAFEAQPADFTVVAGSTPQSASIGTLFAHPLQVNAKDVFSNPLAGVLVVFTPPISGASAVLSSPMAITNASGNASVDARANAIMGGPYDVTASITMGTITFSLTNTLAKLYLPLTIR